MTIKTAVPMKAGRPWQNWGRSVSAHPEFMTQAASIDDVVGAVNFARDAGLTLKPVGAGHSFTAIASTDGVQLDVSSLDGLVAVDGELVTFGAGTHLHQIPALLAPYGLALENMGDIDQQTIAGATSTGTHGTGASFGGLSRQIEALTMVTADGAVVRASATENAELLPAARLGLGALGVVVETTLRCVPDFMLNAVERAEPLEEVLDNWLERASSVDHFEFFWFAHTTSALTKTNTRLPADTPRMTQRRLAAWIDDELLPNRLYAVLCELGARFPATTPPLNRLSERLVATREVTDCWYSVFTSPRRVRFREMEYAIPRANVPDALREIRATIERNGWRITFPVEVRTTASDDNWMSTAYGRDTGYIAVHRYYREDPTEYFAAVEAIMIDFGGRPHWGKMHTRGASDLRPLYPRFDDFLAIRDRLDPGRLFANDYLRKVLGE
ncbi:D-arabinono-1,4-lactone oxidase [Salinibacterium sp.]|uniref:D-arabinono-1,4-lactone oxidase n=1 Tax=Salinibacterium sp. TaxID=1915057 RepID=UPI00286BF1AE|nr:D-arabinono-1,4-lactone oxidase [Salinibacterium sp.]